MYICIYVLKTVRVTAICEGDSMTCEQAGNQGISRNHQDPTGNTRFTCLRGSRSVSSSFLGVPQGPLKHRSGGQRPLTPGPIDMF